jgi:glycosyltransferase involved in cell wall biosynthesis
MDSTSCCSTSGPTAPLTVALVTETYPPEVNGVSLTLAQLVAGLRRRGHRVQLIRPRQSRTDAADDEPGHEEILTPGMPIPGYRGLHFGLAARGRLRRLWSQSRPSIVHVATEGPLGASAVAAARDLSLPVSSGFHTNFDAYSRHYNLGWLRGIVSGHLRRFHNRTDLTLVPTQELAHSLLAHGYRSVRVLARGVDTHLFNPDRRSDTLRARWGAKPDTLVVAHIGRIAPEKNLGLVTEAYAAIAQAHANARMVFVGDGPSLPRMAARQPQHVFAGMRRGEDLATHYASADLFLFPSLTETFGNVVPEALASGLGVVSFDCAAASDLIEDRINGRTVSPGNAKRFIDAAVELATQPRQLNAIRAHAAPSVAELDWERIHDRFAATLAELVLAHYRRRHGEKHCVLVPD